MPIIEKPHKIYAEVVEPTAIEQFESAMSLDCVVRGALMPDVHAGYALPIGAVVATRDHIFPSWVGYDIGCGMSTIRTSFSKEDVQANSKRIFDDIYRSVPVGFSHNADKAVWSGSDMDKTDVTQRIFDKNGLNQLGSLGSGNHFIEIGYDESDSVWVTIHSGSRGIGHAIASHYMRLASGDGKAREGHFGFHADSPDGLDYIKDLNFGLAFALENRRVMIDRVVSVMASLLSSGSAIPETFVNRNHNHAEFSRGVWVHRKGATHAEDGMLGVIPGNMRDGVFVVRGKGNPESIYSSSHGAGRVLGRKKAQELLSMDDFRASMTGITARIEEHTLDESAFAYKDIFEVMRQQSDLVDIVAYVKPLINIKG